MADPVGQCEEILGRCVLGYPWPAAGPYVDDITSHSFQTNEEGGDWRVDQIVAAGGTANQSRDHSGLVVGITKVMSLDEGGESLGAPEKQVRGQQTGASIPKQ